MEVLVVLVIFGLATAVIMPSSARMLDQTTSHAVFFEFQRQVSDFRREANRSGQALRIIEPVGDDEIKDLPDDVRLIRLKSPWTYGLGAAVEIEEGGRCSSTQASLIKGDKVVMSLRTNDGTCHFVRHLGN